MIDDLASLQPWVVRGIKIHGTAEITEESGRASLVIHPVRLWSWGIVDAPFKNGKPASRKARA